MKVKIRKVIEIMDLGIYAPEYDGHVIHVWVNPPLSIKTQYREEVIPPLQEATQAMTEAMGSEDPPADLMEKLEESITQANGRVYKWFANVWSQDNDQATHWTPQEVRDLAAQSVDQDPGLWQFVQTMTWGMMNDFLTGKNGNGPPNPSKLPKRAKLPKGRE